MFKLIRNVDHAFIEAGDFIVGSTLDSDMPGKIAARSFPISFPSLIDWFVNKDYRGREVLDSHICSRSVAKCLIYPKTNKLRGVAWRAAKSIEEIPNIVRNSIFFNKNTEITKTNGFDESTAMLEQGELFLINIRTLFTVKGQNSQAHVSIVNRSLASSLVYYKKDVKKIQSYWSPNSNYTFKVIHDEVEVHL